MAANAGQGRTRKPFLFGGRGCFNRADFENCENVPLHIYGTFYSKTVGKSRRPNPSTLGRVFRLGPQCWRGCGRVTSGLFCLLSCPRSSSRPSMKPSTLKLCDHQRRMYVSVTEGRHAGHDPTDERRVNTQCVEGALCGHSSDLQPRGDFAPVLPQVTSDSCLLCRQCPSEKKTHGMPIP